MSPYRAQGEPGLPLAEPVEYAYEYDHRSERTVLVTRVIDREELRRDFERALRNTLRPWQMLGIFFAAFALVYGVVCTMFR